MALLALAFRLLTGESVRTRDVLPGAVGAALGWQVLQSVGTYYLGSTLRGASADVRAVRRRAGPAGVALPVRLARSCSCAEVNAVRARRLWPRSLLTPFTDDVHLTRGDRKAYESYAETERHKGFETVEVDFDQPPPEEDARRSRSMAGATPALSFPRGSTAGTTGLARRASRSSSGPPRFPQQVPTCRAGPSAAGVVPTYAACPPGAGGVTSAPDRGLSCPDSLT